MSYGAFHVNKKSHSKNMTDNQEVETTTSQGTMVQNWKKACIEFVQKQPYTSSITGVCILAYIIQLFAWKNSIALGGLSAYLVVQKFQLWRVVTYCILHANVPHLVLNMIALLQLGFLMETRMGPVFFLKAIGLVNLIATVLYCAICYAVDLTLSQSTCINTITIGFSGILFGLLSIESMRGGISNAAKVSLYGIVNVPKWTVPWCLVALMYILIPSSSLLGHISGILAGYIFRITCFNMDDDFVDEYWVLGQYVSIPQ